ncbi:MAG TPA: hypothetical protein VHB01_06835 [Nitrosospira sp.]|nr:hypothetical protein [Nitrosospira sp.]
MQNIYRLVGILTITLFSGCANFTSIYRTLDIGDLDRNSPRAVAIDVKQRAIFSITQRLDPKNNQWKSRNIICPESSPDALSATSLGSSISNILSAMTSPGGPITTDQFQAAVATGEAAASIGLRTQSIQLMRDGMVFNCLMYMNGALTERHAYKLQRRNQNSTLGLLAIEQLTNAVKADQVALSSSSQAGSGKENVDKEAAALEAAKTKQISAQSEADKKKLEAGNLETEVKAQQKKTDDARALYQAAVNTDKAKSDATTMSNVASTLATLQGEESTLMQKSNDLQEKNIAVRALQETAKSAAQQVTIAQGALDQASARVSAATNAHALVSASGGRTVLISDNLASTVEKIIKTVLDESGKGEMCEALVDILLYTFSSGYRNTWDEEGREGMNSEIKKAQITSIVDTLNALSCYKETRNEKNDATAAQLQISK